MCPRVKKQTVLVIFEGITDQDTLGQIYNGSYSSQENRRTISYLLYVM